MFKLIKVMSSLCVLPAKDKPQETNPQDLWTSEIQVCKYYEGMLEMIPHNVSFAYISIDFFFPFGKWVNIGYWSLQFVLAKY